jgi:hypothetical protein
MPTATRVQRSPESSPLQSATTTSSSSESELPIQQDIARLAYALWQERGCPAGSPETDWLEAERTLRESAESRTPELRNQ